MRHRRPGVPIAVGLALGLLLVFGLVRSEPAVALESDEQRLLGLINTYRAENGLGALSPSPTLQTAAERHSEDMSTYGFFSHTTQASSYYAPGSGHADRVQAEGYPSDAYTAENLAVDYATPEEVFVAWQNSPGHNSALLDGSYSAAGIGHVGAYWTLNLGSVSGAGEAPETPSAVEEQYDEEPVAQEAQDEEPDTTDEQYEDRYAAQAQYDAQEGGETGPEETSGETTAGASPAGAQYDERAATEEQADAAVPAAPAEDEAEAPSEEAIRRYVAEALAAEEQYDPQGASVPEDGTDSAGLAPEPNPAPIGRASQETSVVEEPVGVEEEVPTVASPSAEPAPATVAGVVEPAAEAESAERAPTTPEEITIEQPATEEAASGTVEVEAAGGTTGDGPSENGGNGEGSVYGIAVLPDTGGVSVGMIALGLLLVCGGLVSRRALR